MHGEKPLATNQLSKYRSSKQRDQILHFLRNDHSHPSAMAVYKALKPQIPSLSLGNLYRNLGILTDMGLISKIQAPEGEEARYDGNFAQHMHFLCLDCHNLFDLPMPEKSDCLTIEGKKWHVKSSQIQLSGSCPTCAKTQVEIRP